MRPFLVFMLGLLVFSGGGMHGKLGSVIAAFIDPGALVEVTPNLPDQLTNVQNKVGYAPTNGPDQIVNSQQKQGYAP